MEDNRKPNKNSFVINIVLFLVLVIISAFLIPIGKTFKYSDFKIGHISPETITAPYGYEIVKSKTELEEDRKRTKRNIIPIYDYVDTLNNKLYYKYISFINDYQKISSLHKKSKSLLSKRTALKLTLEDSTKNKDSYYKEKFIYTDSVYQLTRQNITKKELYFQKKYAFYMKDLSSALLNNKLQKEIRYYLRIHRKNQILNTLKLSIFNKHLGRIVFRHKENKDTLSLGKFKDYQDINTSNVNFLLKYFSEQDNDSLKVWNKVIKKYLLPNVIYNRHLTLQSVDSITNAVPLAKGIVRKGEIIVEKDQVISASVYEKLISLEKKEEEIYKQSKNESFLNKIFFSTFLSNLLNSFLPFLVLFIGLAINRKSIFYNIKKVILLLLVILLELSLNFFLRKYLDNYNEFLVPMSLLSMIVAIFFDVRIAFLATVSTSLIVAMILGNSFTYLYIPLIPAIFSIYSVRKIRDRFQQFVRPFSYLASTYILMAVSFSLTTSNFENLKTNLLFSAISAFIIPILTFGLVVIIEHTFKIATEITLLELTDMTNPLLKKLQMESPGTYHHSMVVGNLAEAASDAIGANSLLARVGAYYHDIGKTFKPEYFVENQQNKENRHDKLPPNMSTLIIVNHVKEGVKLAREYKLPEIIIDFIRMHHGTSRIEFFYHKALKIAEESGEKIDENSFKYPGPKPQTKETAILMIADVVEARARTIDKPDFDTYRHAINEIIKKKFQDGDLEECDLKFNDLTKIREAMVPVIMGMYHSRIKYPDQEKKVKKEIKEIKENESTNK